MKKLLISVLGIALLVPALTFGQAEVKDSKFWFNGERQEQVWGRSSFKLANIVSYHFTGQGGGKYGLGYADRKSVV